MAVLFHDGLDHYGTGNISNSLAQAGGFVASGYSIPTQTISLQTTYARYAAARTGAAQSCGASLSTSNAANQIWIQRAVPVWSTRLVFGFAFKVNAAPASETQILELNAELQLFVLPDLTVRMFGAVQQYKLELGVYYFAEVQIAKDGSAEFWISNTKVAARTGVLATVTSLHVMAKNTTAAQSGWMYVDDFYMLDGSGTTNTSRLGRTNSILRIPTATVEAGFSVSSGSNANHTYVASISPVGDASYVKANKDLQDLYSNPTALLSALSIKAVSVITSSRREDGDDQKVYPVMKSGTVAKDGLPYSQTQYNYTGNFQVFETDPATNARWLRAAVSAASWGQRLKIPVTT
jgi:hypothetical protein